MSQTSRRLSFDDDQKTNLIVNYLPQSMSDDQFRALFARYGDIRSARIIRNKTNGYSYGFGFVDYLLSEDAAHAIEVLNGAMLDNKVIKVSYARPSSDEIKNANLYVSNMPPHFTEKDVRSLFSSYGEIIQCRLLGSRAGTAFVLFNLHGEAKNALNALNNHQISGTNFRISIKFATNEQKKNFNQERKPLSYHNVNSRGSESDDFDIPPPSHNKRPYSSNSNAHSGSSKYGSTNRNSISSISGYNKSFGPMRNGLPPHLRRNGVGPVPSSLDHHNHMTSGGAYSGSFYDNEMNDDLFHHHHSAPSSHQEQQYHHHFSHSSQRVNNGNYSDDGDGGQAQPILFVYNIGHETDEFALEQLFAPFGTVLRVNVIRRSGESRGYGFVTMKHFQDAANAINALDGQRYGNRPLQVSFKKM